MLARNNPSDSTQVKQAHILWRIKRRLSGGSDLTIASGEFPPGGIGGEVSVADTRVYDATADEIITFEYTHGGADDDDLEWIIDLYKVIDHATVMAGGGPTRIGEITVDVEGIRDDGSGTISGTPSLLLENPADITRFILTQLYGVASASLGSTWATTRALLAVGGYKWAFLLEFEEFSKLRLRLGEQARSILYLAAGVWELKFLPDNPTAQLTLDYMRDVARDVPVKIRRTPRADVRNSIWVYSQRDDASGDYRRLRKHEDLTQPGLTEVFQHDLRLDLVQDAATADLLGAFWLSQWKRQRFDIEFTAFWNVLAAEPVDYVRLANHPALAAHGLPVLRVIGKRSGLGEEHPGRIRLRGIEVATDRPTETPDGEEELMRVQGLVGANNAGTPNTQYDLNADAVVARDPGLGQRYVRIGGSPITCNIATAGPAANGRDQSGAFTAGSFVHFYFIHNPGTDTWATLASATAPPNGPTLPSGYTAWAYATTVRFSGASALYSTYARGPVVLYAVPFTDPAVLVGGAAAVDTGITISGFVPSNAARIMLALRMYNTGVSSGGQDSLLLRVVAGGSNVARHDHLSTSTAAGISSSEAVIPNVGQTLRYLISRSSSGGTVQADVYIKGYSVPNGDA